MKFYLIDRVLEMEKDKRLVGLKNLSLAEEYLQDHFPGYPVLPGVMMIEAVVQAAAWLVRVSTDFSHSMVVLEEARNTRYGAFFYPGTTMKVEVDLVKHDEGGGLWTFKGSGSVGDSVNVQGRLTLRAFNLAEDKPEMAETDAQIISAIRSRWQMISRDMKTT